MKSKLFLLLVASFMLVGCTNAANEASSEKSQEGSQSEGSQGSDTSSQSSDESSESSGGAEGERIFKAQFYSVNDGTAVTGNSDNSAYTTTVQSYFLDDEQQLLTNASSPEGYSQINYIGNAGQEGRFSTMILGSSSRAGRLKLQFNCYIIKAKVEAQGYCKYIPYNDSWSVDSDCSLSLAGQDGSLELPTSAGEQAEVKTKEYTFAEPVNILDFSTGEGRVFLNSLEITYCVY